jgi:hypothetical protein
MRHAIGVVMGVALVVGGCGAAGGGPGFESAEAGARAVADGFTSKDATIAERLLPPEELLKAHFDCPEDQLVKQRQKRLADWPQELAKAPAGMKMEVTGFIDDQASSETLARDADYKGCKVKEAVTVKKIKAELKVTVEGKVEDEDEGFTFVKFGDEERWYFFKL